MLNEKLPVEVVEAQMKIRRPVAVVFDAFVDPAVTQAFWFSRSTGKLESGATVDWHWEMYNISTKVFVREVLPGTGISIDWGEPASRVDFAFKRLGDESTYVTIRHHGFKQVGPELINILKDSTGGFTTVLDGLKAFLEHGIRLNLIEDKFPSEIFGNRE